MSQLAEYLAIPLWRPVLDQTGLTGRYDFTVDLTVHAGRDTQPDDIASLVLTAAQEQLGLKLEARKKVRSVRCGTPRPGSEPYRPSNLHARHYR